MTIYILFMVYKWRQLNIKSMFITSPRFLYNVHAFYFGKFARMDIIYTFGTYVTGNLDHHIYKLIVQLHILSRPVNDTNQLL
jgi:hypothetical protein